MCIGTYKTPLRKQQNKTKTKKKNHYYIYLYIRKLYTSMLISQIFFLKILNITVIIYNQKYTFKNKPLQRENSSAKHCISVCYHGLGFENPFIFPHQVELSVSYQQSYQKTHSGLQKLQKATKMLCIVFLPYENISKCIVQFFSTFFFCLFCFVY